MTVAFSTSSAVASVALLTREGDVVFHHEAAAQGRAGEVCLAGLEAGLSFAGIELADVERFAADLGPGSFTGVRVGIVLAKMLAWQTGRPCCGADAFDLVDADSVVVLPSRRGEWFVRTPGQPIARTHDVPEVVHAPRAAGFGPLLARLPDIRPEALVPAYLLEPSISLPKKPFGRPDVA